MVLQLSTKAYGTLQSVLKINNNKTEYINENK